MKRLIASALVTVAGLCSVGNLQAQTREVRANVPFKFIVSGKQLPAGNYEFLANGASFLVIRNREQPIAVQSMIVGQDRTVAVANSKLVFTKYGDSYFLREIHSSALGENGTIPRSKQEKQAEQQEASVQHPDTVMLALGN